MDSKKWEANAIKRLHAEIAVMALSVLIASRNLERAASIRFYNCRTVKEKGSGCSSDCEGSKMDWGPQDRVKMLITEGRRSRILS